MTTARPRGGVQDGADRTTWRTVRFGKGRPWSLPQLGLALTGVASAVAFLLCLQAASGGFDPVWWALAIVPLATLGFAGSAAPLAFWGLMLAGWFLLTPSGSLSAWSVPAAVALAVGHAAAALSATTPPAGGLPVRVVRTWVGRVVLAALTAPAVAALAGALRSGELEASPAAYVIGLGGLAVGVFLLRTEPPAQPD